MAQKFLDIFSKKQKIKKQNPKQKVIVDYRERNSLVPASLVKLGLEVEFKELKVADYITNGAVVERKTISDFITSMINKRLLKQLGELQQYKTKLIIIEGIDSQELYDDTVNGINGNAIRGFLLSISLKHKIPIIFSKNSEDTAKFISVLAKKQKQQEISLNAKKRNLTKKEQMQFVLESFPKIGPATARKLLEKFETLSNIFSTPQEELEKIIGKKAEIFKLIKERY